MDEKLAGFRNLVVGVDTKIPLINGQMIKAINFDNAATTPPFASVLQEIVKFAPWYSSIHRGTGYKSQFTTRVYEESRKTVMDFVKADTQHDTVIYVKNATEAINKLSNRLIKKGKKDVILTTCMEHHSNDLPWRGKYTVEYISIDKDGKLSMKDLETKLNKYKGSIRLVTITGASNVTGYINPVYDIAKLVHKYNIKLLVDGAQLVPHQSFDMKPVDSSEHIDYLVFSAHKMYAPFGTGVLIGPRETFMSGAPDYSGGGTVKVVTEDEVVWAEVPDKEEAGTPNVMGVVALTQAIKTLEVIGMESVRHHECSLLMYAIQRLREIPDIELYGSENYEDERVGIIPFNVRGLPHDITAKILSFEAGVAVRNGCFCAQPYIHRLLGVKKEDMKKYIKDEGIHRPGMVRISFGLYNDFGEIDVLIEALNYICQHKEGYIRKYRMKNGEY